MFAEQVVELFDELAAARADGPWLTVASFVNPHDIAFSGFGWEQMLRLRAARRHGARHPRGAVAVGLVRRTARRARRRSRRSGRQMIFETATDLGYRRLYYYLLKLVDQAIGRILEALGAVGHGRRHHRRVHLGPRRPARRPRRTDPEVVQRVRRGHPGAAARRRSRASSPERGGVNTPTSHVDLIPTLLGLAGIDVERAAAGVAAHHDEAQPLPGRDLSGVVRGRVDAGSD